MCVRADTNWRKMFFEITATLNLWKCFTIICKSFQIPTYTPRRLIRKSHHSFAMINATSNAMKCTITFPPKAFNASKSSPNFTLIMIMGVNTGNTRALTPPMKTERDSKRKRKCSINLRQTQQPNSRNFIQKNKVKSDHVTQSVMHAS